MLHLIFLSTNPTIMSRLLYAILCLSLSLPILAQDQPKASGPLADISEKYFVFGNIQQGEIISHDFVITNAGDEPLLIMEAISSCTCATSRWPAEPIAPGKSAVVNYTFDSAEEVQEQNHRLTLKTNAAPADYYLHLIGRVVIGSPAVPTTFDLPPAPAGPTTSVDFEETTFDFGTIIEGEKIAHTYTFTNAGDEPLVISDAKGSCGCTIPAWPREPIAPGETASITVEFNSKGKRGKRNQKVTLTANTNPPQTFIYLTGQIEPRDAEIEIPPLLAPEESPATEAPPAAAPAVSQAPAIAEPDPNCVTLFPNPTTDLLQLEMGEQAGQPATFALYSYTGQLMARRQVEAVDAIVSFDVRHYPAGSYVVQLQVGQSPPETLCFVVKK